MTQTAFTKWFETFLEEKNLPYAFFEVEHNGQTHMIDTDFVVELIKTTAPAEQAQIKNIIVQIDFKNGNVNHFFEHLAKGYVANNF